MIHKWKSAYSGTELISTEIQEETDRGVQGYAKRVEEEYKSKSIR